MYTVRVFALLIAIAAGSFRVGVAQPNVECRLDAMALEAKTQALQFKAMIHSATASVSAGDSFNLDVWICRENGLVNVVNPFIQPGVHVPFRLIAFEESGEYFGDLVSLSSDRPISNDMTYELDQDALVGRRFLISTTADRKGRRRKNMPIALPAGTHLIQAIYFRDFVVDSTSRHGRSSNDILCRSNVVTIKVLEGQGSRLPPGLPAAILLADKACVEIGDKIRLSSWIVNRSPESQEWFDPHVKLARGTTFPSTALKMLDVSGVYLGDYFECEFNCRSFRPERSWVRVPPSGIVGAQKWIEAARIPGKFRRNRQIVASHVAPGSYRLEMNYLDRFFAAYPAPRSDAEKPVDEVALGLAFREWQRTFPGRTIFTAGTEIEFRERGRDK